MARGAFYFLFSKRKSRFRLTEPCIKVNEALTGTAVTVVTAYALEITAGLVVISKFSGGVPTA